MVQIQAESIFQLPVGFLDKVNRIVLRKRTFASEERQIARMYLEFGRRLFRLALDRTECAECGFLALRRFVTVSSRLATQKSQF
jgi:hypothetical protein